MGIIAQGSNSDQPTYAFGPTGVRLGWVQFLRAWAEHVTSNQPDAAGAWVCALLHQAAAEAHRWRVAGPAEHSARREAAEAMDRAYLRELESLARTLDEAGYDPNDPASTGSLLGPDEHCLHAWISPPEDQFN